MNLVDFSCRRCGGELKEIEKGYFRCLCCRSVYYEDRLEKDADVLSRFLDETKKENLSNLRRLLWNELQKENLDSEKILYLCNEIKKLSPEDFYANMYEVLNGGTDKEVCEFIDKFDKKENYEDVPDVLSFMLKSLKPSHLLSVANLIERTYSEDRSLYEKYMTKFEEEAEKVERGVYDPTIPRDVFIMYSSKDMEKVKSLTQYLEESGISCFVSARNLQHGRGAVANYEKSLEKAMDNCRVIVFVSSTNSRRTDCEAISLEMPYIKKKDLSRAPAEYANIYDKLPDRYKKPRVEYVIEGYTGKNGVEQTTKEFFGTLQWAQSEETVAKRVTEIITAIPEIEEPTRGTTTSSNGGNSATPNNGGNTVIVIGTGNTVMQGDSNINLQGGNDNHPVTSQPTQQSAWKRFFKGKFLIAWLVIALIVASIVVFSIVGLHEHSFIEVAEGKYLKSAATCVHKSIYYKSCSDCGAKGKETFEYGELGDHNYAEIAEAEYLKSEATYTQKAVYYKSCSVCGLKSEETFEYGDYLHTYVEVVDDEYLKSEATCTQRAIYYKSCSECGKRGAETFEHGEIKSHSFAEIADEKYLKSQATYTQKAVYYKSCEMCGLKSEETFEYGEFKEHTPDDDLTFNEKTKTLFVNLDYFQEAGKIDSFNGVDNFDGILKVTPYVNGKQIKKIEVNGAYMQRNLNGQIITTLIDGFTLSFDKDWIGDIQITLNNVGIYTANEKGFLDISAIVNQSKVTIEYNGANKIIGHDGTYSSESQSALIVQDLEVKSSDASASLSIYGGNGMDGARYGATGQDGAAAIKVNSLMVNTKGELNVSGGKGGNGADGEHGENGKSYGDGNWWSSSNGGAGENGQKGGNGGSGGSAVTAQEIMCVCGNITFAGGNSGDAGNGGDGGDGGKGANADAVWAHAGNGGKGGDGGNGGICPSGAKAIVGNLVDDVNQCSISLIDGIRGKFGKGGAAGNGGKGGSTNGWVGASSGSSGSKGRNGIGYRAETSLNGHTYILMQGNLLWSTAEAYAESYGGHLATVTTEEENAILRQMVVDSGYDGVWLGAENSSGTWAWVTGEEWSYTYWGTSEPSLLEGMKYGLAYNKSKSYWSGYIDGSIADGFIIEFDS